MRYFLRSVVVFLFLFVFAETLINGNYESQAIRFGAQSIEGKIQGISHYADASGRRLHSHTFVNGKQVLSVLYTFQGDHAETGRRHWKLEIDKNEDHEIDMGGLIKLFCYVYYYPGDVLVQAILVLLPAIAKFIEPTFGSWFSGISSFLLWSVIIFTIFKGEHSSPVRET